MSYYLLELGPKEQQRIRVQPLLEAGFRLEDAIKFDQRFSDQSFRWPWEKNEAYRDDEIKFAEMWLNNSVITEILLNYYYCASSNYYSLVWLLGSIKRGVSFWNEAVKFVVYGDVNNDGISNYDSLLRPNADVLDPILPNPATIYAIRQGLPKDWIERINPLGEDGILAEWERNIIDDLDVLPPFTLIGLLKRPLESVV